MTTTNVYQGLSEKSTSRVLKAPGGGSSNIFGHYVEDEEKNKSQQRQKENLKVEQSLSHGQVGAGDQSGGPQRDKESYNANKARSYGAGAPFATSDGDVLKTPEKSSPQQNFLPDDYQTPQQRQANECDESTDEETEGGNKLPANENPNKAPNTFNNLFGDNQSDADKSNSKAKGKEVMSRLLHCSTLVNPITGVLPFLSLSNLSDQNSQTSVSWQKSSSQIERNPLTGEGVDNVASPTIRCYADMNVSIGNRNPLTGQGIQDLTNICANKLPTCNVHNHDLLRWSEHSVCQFCQEQDHHRAKGQGTPSLHQVSTHNPVTWEAYSNYDADQDRPAHRSRYESHATSKAGTFNPITGQDYDAPPQQQAKVKMPPGGKSSIQF